MTTNTNYAAACIGTDPVIFDLPETEAQALAICDTCTVRLWCLQFVNPAESYHDGVVGGQAWSNGRVINSDTIAIDLDLKIYLSQVEKRLQIVERSSLRKVTEPDHLGIEALIAGHIDYKKLSSSDRRIAARRMRELGWSTSEIQAATHLSGNIIKITLGLSADTDLESDQS